MKLKDLEQLSAMKVEIAVLEERLNNIHVNSNQYVADTAKDYSTGYEQIITIRGYTVFDTEKAEKIAALLQKRRTKLDEKILAAEEFVACITDSRMRTLITLRYIEGKNWRAVASKVYGTPCEDRARKAVKKFFEEKI